MTDRERLEEIKAQYYLLTRNGYDLGAWDESFSWLIEQAERVQELEELSAHHLKMLKYCSDARKKYYGVIKTLYEFDGDVQEHSALADMLCSEALEELECNQS